MTNKERAEKIFREQNYNFELDTSDLGNLNAILAETFKPIHIFCTTDAAMRLTQVLQPELHIVATDPEFLGFTIEEIEDNCTEDPE